MFRRAIVSTLAILLLAGCGDDDGGTPLTPETLAGDYHAVTLTVDGESVLTGAASIELTLNEDGTTEGRMFIPEGAGDGSDFDEELNGLWESDGETVTLIHDASTFLRNMPLTIDDDRLVGEEEFSEGVIRVELEKD